MIEIIQNKDDLKKLASAWERLAKPLETPLMSHDWILSCVESFCEEENLRIIIIYDGSRITAIAPLILVKQNGINRLELIGTSLHYEPCGFLFESEDSLSELLKTIIKMRYPLYLQRISSNTIVPIMFRRLTRCKWVYVERSGSNSLWIPNDSSWEEKYNSFSPKQRYEFRLKRRRAEKVGKVSIKIFCPEPYELNYYLNLAFQIEAKGWKYNKGSALMINKKLQKLFCIYSELACKKKILRLCFIFINEKAIGMTIGLEYAKRFWVLKIGFDEKWKRCSPGMLLTLETICYSFKNGLKSYEFLGSDDPWKHIWAKHFHTYSYLLAYPISIYGLFGLCREVPQLIKKRILSP